MIDLARSLSTYQARFPEEKAIVQRFHLLLQHPDAFQRTHLPGHVTGSAFIVNADRTHTLLVHHAKLNKWLQPGGHADGDNKVLRVALREAEEETGVKELTVRGEGIFDLDVHPIPARVDFPAHDHYDIRFLIEADMAAPLIVSEESHDVRWVPLRDIEAFNNEESLLRLARKSIAFD